MKFDELALSNVNSLWAAVAVDVLRRLGLRHAVIAPGSRSTPLTFAISREPGIEAVAVMDERSASFFALGLAKRERRPTVLVCTSGTAAANFYPAVIEARQSEVPLLLLTADRPPELRHCHAGQTIDQTKLYGGYLNFEAEMSLPNGSVQRLGYLRQTLVHAWERTRYPVGGPVHLNFPFRDPLAPATEGGQAVRVEKAELEALLLNVRPPIITRPCAKAVDLERLTREISTMAAGIIVVGPTHPGNPDRWTAAISRLAKMSGWPVLADALGPLRSRSGAIPNLICHYDTILRSPEWAERLAPEVVISVGALPTSRILREWLVRKSTPTWVIDPGLDNKDGLHREAQPVRVSVEDLAGAIQENSRRQSGLCRDWSAVERRVRKEIARELQRCDFAFEGKVPWILSQVLTADTALVVANSMPVRDMECFWQKGNEKVEVYFSRGANGIDGTLSTALGVAHASGQAVLLTGDLAFLHDTNGMLIHPRLKGHLTVLLLNNRGSGIFETLPIAKLEPPFEEYFAMPQEVSFRRLANAYGADYERILDLDGDLPGLLREFPKSGIRLLEISCDRKRDHRWRQSLFQDIARRL